LSEFNKTLSLIIDPRQLKLNIISKIQEIIHVKRIFLFLYNEDFQRYGLSDVIGVDKGQYSKYYLTSKDKLIYWLSVNEKHILLKQNDGIRSFFSIHEQNMLCEMDVAFISPLKVMNRLTGLVFLGHKVNGKDYKSDEVELLKILLDQAALAFENASLYQSQKDRLKKMYRSDRLAMMGQLAAGAAHEIRNPLTSIRSTIQYVQKDIKDPVKAKMTSELINEVDRINEIIHGLLSFSNPDKLNKEQVDLLQLISQSILLITNTAKKKNCEVELEYNTDNRELFADPSQLKQVFLNILMNAIQAIKDVGKISIIIDLNERVEKGFNKPILEYIISIIDTGIGISPENLEKIFDPFFTTKEDGTGLGLSISYGIIVQNKGDIAIESEVGKGTKVVVKLPVSD
jgi:signal transduction histidine kinase